MGELMNRSIRDQVKELAETIVKVLVDNPNQLHLTVIEGEQSVIVEVNAESRDVAKIIGQRGRNIDAVRTILNSVGVKLGKRITVEVIG